MLLPLFERFKGGFNFISMARIKDKQKAIELRLKGKSYSEIPRELVVSKSTLSEWLRNFPLSRNKFLELSREERRVESYRATMNRKRKTKLESAYSKAKDIIGNLNNENYLFLEFSCIGEKGIKMIVLFRFLIQIRIL